jgi:hypothetical protein
MHRNGARPVLRGGDCGDATPLPDWQSEAVVGEQQGLSFTKEVAVSAYIRVLGPNPDYEGSKLYFFLHTSLVAKIYPVWAEIKDGKAWRCTPNHPNAQVVSCTLVDHAGNQYSCGNFDELRKLLAENDLYRLFGKEPPELEKKHFGFIYSKDKPEEQVDLTEPKRGPKKDE